MPTISSTTSEVVSVAFLNPKTEIIQTSATPNTETLYTLRSNVKRFTISNRGIAKIKLSYTATESGTQFKTLFPNAPYPEDNIGVGSLTFYLQSPLASQDLEIVSWL